MLSCDTARARLPGMATGERPSPDLREHLASCAKCRAERERCVVDVERIREGLAELAPSPFLEDHVAEALSTPPAARPRRPWAYVAAAVLAAAALFLVVVLPRMQEPPAETGDPLPVEEGTPGRASIQVPPSAAEVAQARTHNRPAAQNVVHQLPEGEELHKSYHRGGRIRKREYPAFLPPEPDALHRWVYGGKGALAGPREETVTTWPRAGVALLGNALIEELGCVLRWGELLKPGKRWQTTPGSWEGEITLGAPGPKAADARARVLVSTGYSGTLMVEGPLARALGLHLFEVPGGVRLVSPDGTEVPVRAQRARARVRIPELDVDRVMEVQVVPARPWMVKRAAGDDARGIRFEGEAPTAALHGEGLELDASGTLVLEGATVLLTDRADEAAQLGSFDPGEGTVRMALRYPAPDVPSPGVVGTDVPILGELFQHRPALVVPRALDFHAHDVYDFQAERVELRGKWEPGAEVTIAKVWRGTTALPSAEPVVRTTVRANEWISFPRIAGEPSSSLRMLVTTKDGVSTFQEVVVAPELRAHPRVELHLRSDGYVQVGRGAAVFLYSPPWRGDEAQPKPDPAHAATLREALRKAVDLPKMRTETGASYFEARLNVGFGTPWRLVQWVMQVAADPAVGISRISVRSGDTDATVTPIALPRGRGLGSSGLGSDPEASAPRVEVSLHRLREGEPLVVRVFHQGTGAEVSWGAGEFEGRVRDAVVAVQGASLGLQGLVRVPPPGLVHHAEVVRVIDAFRAAGIEDVRFEGAPMR